ncbi:MAG: cytochrome c peroxidase, partial [Gammaproteobacteria bacterium]
MPVTLNMVRRRVAAGLTTLLVLAPAHAHFGPIPLSLKGVPTPPVPGLIDGPAPIVVDVEKAIALGKALFWDINVGSDGMACASCHFHAGADSRTRNQLAPGGGRMLAVDAYFDSLPDGNRAAPNHVLRRRDFPLQRTPDPLNPVAPITHESDDTVGSAGTFKAAFEDVAWLGPAADACRHVADPVFHLGARSTRQVVPRNAPTVINAVFNHRNFWDGRANNVFNGSSPWGDRDPHAGVWVDDAGTLVKQRLHLINSSLASQAITPPTNAVEMSCSGRRFADLGRKLMWRRPLEQQFVHPEDSALGAYSMNRGAHPRRGLSTRYYWLVRQAFDSRYWRSTQRGGELGEPVSADGMRPVPYDQFEANFAMFFAIAIQLYESTLVSDDAPFDRSAVDAEGLPVDLSPQALEGLAEFRVAHCSLCHIGPLLTAAAIETNAALARTHPAAFNNQAFAISTTRNVVTRMAVKHDDGAGSTFGAAAIIDTGFSGNGVTRAAWDIGLGAHDPFGNPLSFARQYLGLLAGDPGAVVDAAVREVRPCDFDTPL